MKIKYDGEYPYLCSGNLIVEHNGKVWEFPENCLESGGNVSFDEDWNEKITTGKWSISEYPKDFPEELKNQLIEIINQEIPHGCCGGCV